MTTDASDRRPEPAEPAIVDDSYWSSARRPLYVLAFLALPIVAYELCLALLLRDATGLNVVDVEAHHLLVRAFAAFRIAPAGGLYLGGLLIVVVLLVWHVLLRDPLRLDPRILPIMLLETIALTVPLLVLSHLMAPGTVAATPTGQEFAGNDLWATLDVWSKISICIGAGLYEEFVFRMILIAVIHTLLVDIARAPHAVGTVVSIVVAAIAFMLYHDLHLADGTISSQKVAFYFGAGLYLGAVFALRGFGLAVGVHALYDIATVLVA